MAWHIVQKLVEGTGEHSTLIGKFWVTLFFVIRFLLIVAIAKNTWSSNQGDFVCNTKSPGCHQVCFNAFNPISPISFWSFQLLSVAIASIIFHIYTTHKLALVTKALDKKKKFEEEKKKKAKELMIKSEGEEGDKEAKKEEKKEEAEKKDDDKKGVVATKLNAEHPSKLYIAYFAMVFFRLAVEIGFMVAQYFVYSYKFVIPELFQCQHWPCPNAVDCFVSRPKEKTIMLCAFFVTGCIMVVLNLMELLQLTGKISDAWSARGYDVTKEVFGDEAGPQFDQSRGMRRWGPGAEGIYVQPSGYPDAVGIPTLYTYGGRHPKRSRFSRRR